ncbi:family 16 glycosylhydrolase [Namhaeicola litoreus]|uniref:Family 16 glycosylhydrolase n=1 Tax=Namhaeicola litoreus TaxID=1052145 RepID=A0ABW3Y040_9FLAO
MKIIKILFSLFLTTMMACSSSGSDVEDAISDNNDNNPLEETWITIPVPANSGPGKKWEFQKNISDNFEYDSPANNKGATFLDKWDDWYHNAWTGPEPTIFSREHSFVTNNELNITAGRPIGTNNTNTGIVTSTNRVIYPVYIEARVKIMNSTLANAVWLLSPDDTQEIDIVEAYGGDRFTNPWFGPKRVHLSHHVFIRQPFQDWQPNDEGSFYTDGQTVWRNDFHRYGVYWKDPWNLEYYIDGKLVRTRSGVAQIDPQDFTNGTGLSKEMDIIISAEDQTWRANQGLSPTNVEIENTANNTFKIDWIRVFKPIDN